MRDYEFLSICASLIIISTGFWGFARRIEGKINELLRRTSKIEIGLRGLSQKSKSVEVTSKCGEEPVLELLKTSDVEGNSSLSTNKSCLRQDDQ